MLLTPMTTKTYRRMCQQLIKIMDNSITIVRMYQLDGLRSEYIYGIIPQYAPMRRTAENDAALSVKKCNDVTAKLHHSM